MGRGQREGGEGMWGREGGWGIEGGRGGEGGRGEGEGRDDCYTYSKFLIGMFNSNPMIPQYLNNNLT